MRKIKKINGYLVVRFNDREKRLYEGTGLGNYGVIDAELYTGSLKLDRRDMKYDSVDTLEEAAELARSLEAEVDLSGEPATCAVIVETGDSYSERKVEPERMVRNWEDELVKQIGSAGCPDTDSRTASYALYGYTAALCDLGFLPEDRCSLDSGAFGRYDTPGNPDSSRESLRSYICDELCRHRSAGNTQEELAAICAKCPAGLLPDGMDAPDTGRSTAMTGLDIIRNPATTADQIADIFASGCPPIVSGECRGRQCHECWLAWLTAREVPGEGREHDKTE